MQLGLVLGGMAQGATKTLDDMSQQRRLNQEADDLHAISSKPLETAADLAGQPPVQIGTTIGAKGPAYTIGDFLMGKARPAPVSAAPKPSPFPEGGFPASSYATAPTGALGQVAQANAATTGDPGVDGTGTSGSSPDGSGA